MKEKNLELLVVAFLVKLLKETGDLSDKIGARETLLAGLSFFMTEAYYHFSSIDEMDEILNLMKMRCLELTKKRLLRDQGAA